MKQKQLQPLLILLCTIALVVSAYVVTVWAQADTTPTAVAPLQTGPGFTFQGQLRDHGAPLNATCDVQAGLWDAGTAGTQVGDTQTLHDVEVANGRFTLTLNAGGEFGAGAFTGEARWLQIALRCPAGSGSYSTLQPRQRLAAAPYAQGLLPGAVISGSIGSGTNAILSLRNLDANGVGLRVFDSGLDGVFIDRAGRNGVYIGSAQQDGVFVCTTGNNASCAPDPTRNGIEVGRAWDNGILIDSAGSHGLGVTSAGDKGVAIVAAGTDGLFVCRTGDTTGCADDETRNGVEIYKAENDGVYVANALDNGLRVGHASESGVLVEQAGEHGLSVLAAADKGVAIVDSGTDGLFICRAGTSQSCMDSATNNGVEIYGSENNGIYIDQPSGDGIFVCHAGEVGACDNHENDHGIEIHNARGAGVWIDNSDQGVVISDVTNGFVVRNLKSSGVGASALNAYIGFYASATSYGIQATGSLWSGVFNTAISVNGGCFGCQQAIFGLNVDDIRLQPGDVLTLKGMRATDPANGALLLQVARAKVDDPVVGVFLGVARMHAAPAEAEHGVTERLAPAVGEAAPGDYVAILYSGPAQVRVAPGATVGLGQPLVTGAGGLLQPAPRLEIDGMRVPVDRPRVGIALEEADADADGLLWVLVGGPG